MKIMIRMITSPKSSTNSWTCERTIGSTWHPRHGQPEYGEHSFTLPKAPKSKDATRHCGPSRAIIRTTTRTRMRRAKAKRKTLNDLRARPDFVNSLLSILALYCTLLYFTWSSSTLFSYSTLLCTTPLWSTLPRHSPLPLLLLPYRSPYLYLAFTTPLPLSSTRDHCETMASLTAPLLHLCHPRSLSLTLSLSCERPCERGASKQKFNPWYICGGQWGVRTAQLC